MVLNPAATIWSSVWSIVFDQRPSGAKAPVSSPDQFTPVSRTSRPATSTILLPLVRSGPVPSGGGVAVGGTGVAVGGTGVAVAVGGRGVGVAVGGGGSKT